MKKCCMCGIRDNNVKTLNKGVNVHPRCMEMAALGQIVKDKGWEEDNSQEKPSTPSTDTHMVCPKCGRDDGMVDHGDGKLVCHHTHPL